ncbi:hypothetical protein O181_055531 [Austropuccinia psidii MF-1]|uniref:Uncharacterized protein n=1 Tax=Austropuccinia psidii MF-1 TaxID=1389203 RepID=A0A9Q3HS49_9BASI|nr:hypothetical protein [Austropuccinia psidii MF-1]
MAGVGLYAYLLLLHKEIATGHHHKDASKQRMGHASLSRETIVHYEDEEMSPTPSETNGEPRRDNFMAHGEGTWGNSGFTHPQMLISQSMLDQSKMIQGASNKEKTG